jgi:hypothetical protein
MTTQDAQKMVSSARRHLMMERQNKLGCFVAVYRQDAAYDEAWRILFAAENLLSDPNQPHYIKILEAAHA